MEIVLGYGKANIIMYKNGSKRMMFWVRKASKSLAKTLSPPLNSQNLWPSYIVALHTLGFVKYIYLISQTIKM